MAEEVLSPSTQAALAVAEKFVDGRFPEYFTYPERRLLVEGDRVRDARSVIRDLRVCVCVRERECVCVWFCG
jgi:hypothetical protein